MSENPQNSSIENDPVALLSLAGFALLPADGKTPAVEKGFDWTTIQPDPFLSRDDFPKNYAVIVGTNHLVIDIDVKKDNPGKESYRKLCLALGLEKNWENKTFVVRTGSGGYHVYLSAPACNVSKHHKDYPGLEFLSGNMYAIGPGSIHPDTKQEYKVVYGDPRKLLPAPENLLALLTPVTVIAPEPAAGFVDDDPLNVQRFEDLLAQMPIVPQGNRGNSCYIAACKGRDLGISEAKNVEILLAKYNGSKLQPPLEKEELELVVKNAYKYANAAPGTLNVAAIFKTAEVGEQLDLQSPKYDVSPKGVVRSTLNNAVNYIATLPQLKEVFRLNTFTNMVEIASCAPWWKERGSRGANVVDEDVVLLKYLLTRVVNVEFPTETLWDAVIVVAHKRHYHPIRQYLHSLSWDGTPRIDTWMRDYGHAPDNVYTRNVSRKVLCAAVRRVFEPGCKFDYVTIIEGAQGIGKSTTCRVLGRSWSGDMNLDPHQKDSIAMMQGKWIIELSEMTALRWHDANALKSFISRGSDTARLAYERHAKDFARQSIFIGTVNPEHVGYLNDITGNRRFWIVPFFGMVDFVGLENVCDQLWAEAAAVYRSEPLFLSGESERLQCVEAAKRMPEDPMRGNVNKWVIDNPNVECTTAIQVLEYLGVPAKNIQKIDISRCGQNLVDLGWEKRVEKDGLNYVTRYYRPGAKGPMEGVLA